MLSKTRKEREKSGKRRERSSSRQTVQQNLRHATLIVYIDLSVVLALSAENHLRRDEHTPVANEIPELLSRFKDYSFANSNN